MITKQTENLFQRAIIMSGSALNKTWSLTLPKDRAERLAINLGWKGKAGDENALLSFLEDVPAFELDDASKALLTDEEQFGYGFLIPFGPVIEPYITENCIVPKEPVEMTRETWSNKIDLIVMGSSFEGLLRANVGEDRATKILQNSSYFAPLQELCLGPSDETAETFGEKIKKIYYEDGQEPSLKNQEQYLKVKPLIV